MGCAVTVLQYSRLTSGIMRPYSGAWGSATAAFRPLGCHLRSQRQTGIAPGRVAAARLARGPQSVLRHAARFPRPTDSAGLTDNVSEHRGTDGEW